MYFVICSGSDMGLRLTLNIEEYEHIEGISTDSGIKVTITDKVTLFKIQELFKHTIH